MQVPLLPPTVTDQIRLWEMEKNRLEAIHGYLFKEFNTLQDYEMAVQYARELGWVMWEKKERRMFFCRDEGKDSVIQFIQRRVVKNG